MSIIKGDQAPLFLSSNQNYILNRIEKEEENTSRDLTHLSLAQKLAKEIIKHRINDKLELGNVVCSSLLCIIFILETYEEFFNLSDYLIMYWIEFSILTILSMDWLLFLFIAENRLVYLFQFQSVVSYVSIISQYIIIHYQFE